VPNAPEPVIERTGGEETARPEASKTRPKKSVQAIAEPAQTRAESPRETPEALLERLRLFHARMTHHKETIDRERLAGLERRYFALRTAIRPDLTDSRCRELAAEINALEHDLNP
jgi:hypothetical protein